MSLRSVAVVIVLVAACVGGVVGWTLDALVVRPQVADAAAYAHGASAARVAALMGAAVGLVVGLVAILVLLPTVLRPARRVAAELTKVAAGLPLEGPTAIGGVEELRRAGAAIDRVQTRLDAGDADLQRTRLEGDASAAVQARFLTTLGHAVRTPMSGILGMTLELLESPLDAPQRACAETIRASADSLLTVLNEVVDVSRVEAGRVELDSVDFDLGVLVEDAMDVLAQRSREKGLSTAYEIEPGVPRLLRGDPAHLRQTLLHLAGNAVKFTERGEVVVTVSLDGRSGERASVRFTVVDTGPGLDDDRLAHVFEPSAPVLAPGARGDGPGPGLGLSVARRLAERMGGCCGAESRLGVGSTFWFTALLDVRGAPDGAVAAPADVRGARVLVVDDHERGRSALVHVLEAWGLRCTTAAGARDAWSALSAGAREDDPHRVVLVGAGAVPAEWEAFGRSVRADSALSSTRLILLATVGLRGDAARYAAAGYAAYLVKPVRPSHLFEAVGAVLSTSPVSKPATLVTRHSIEESRRRGARVLLVEDNDVNRTVAKKLLERMGHTVDLAKDGREAVDRTRATAYDVVLMDVQMPVLDGYEATLAIRRREGGTTHVPIVAMTANAMAGDREKCLSVGMDDYLAKPVRPEDLSAAIERAWARPAPPLEDASALRRA